MHGPAGISKTAALLRHIAALAHVEGHLVVEIDADCATSAQDLLLQAEQAYGGSGTVLLVDDVGHARGADGVLPKGLLSKTEQASTPPSRPGALGGTTGLPHSLFLAPLPDAEARQALSAPGMPDEALDAVTDFADCSPGAVGRRVGMAGNRLCG